MNTKDRSKLHRKAKEVCASYCMAEWCIFREMFVSSHENPRNLIQLKCLAILKLNMSTKAGEDVGWDEAGLMWIESGMAKAFSQFYTEELTAEQIYDLVEAAVIKDGKYTR